MRDELIQQTLVVLDPGKGGEELGGNIRLDSGWLKEKDINLSLAYILNGYLRMAGIDVVMSRYGDDNLGINKRVEIINALHPDIVISLNMAPHNVYFNCIFQKDVSNNSEIICEFLKEEINAWNFFKEPVAVLRRNKGIMGKTYAPCIHFAVGNVTKWLKDRESFARPEFLLEYAQVLGHALLEGFKRANWERWPSKEEHESPLWRPDKRNKKRAAPRPPEALAISGQKWKPPD